MLIKISSSDRTEGSPYNFKANLQKPIAAGRYVLGKVMINNSFYNINSSNNTINFTSSAVPYVAVVEPGFYNESNIEAAIQSAMNAALSNSFVCTLNDTTGIITITGTATFSITTANEVLGLSISASDATSQTSSILMNLSPIKEYNLLINRGVGSEVFNPVTGGMSNFLIPITVTSKNYQIYTKEQDGAQYITFQNGFSTLEVRVVDATGSDIQLKTDWYFCLERI